MILFVLIFTTALTPFSTTRFRGGDVSHAPGSVASDRSLRSTSRQTSRRRHQQLPGSFPALSRDPSTMMRAGSASVHQGVAVEAASQQLPHQGSAGTTHSGPLPALLAQSPQYYAVMGGGGGGVTTTFRPPVPLISHSSLRRDVETAQRAAVPSLTPKSPLSLSMRRDLGANTMMPRCGASVKGLGGTMSATCLLCLCATTSLSYATAPTANLLTSNYQVAH